MRAYFLCFLLSLAAPLAAQDVALITQVQGEIQLAPAQGEPRATQALIKLAAGDRLLLSQQALVQIVFFNPSQQETWRGKGEIQIAANGGHSSDLKAQIRQLPAIVSRQLAKTPSVGDNARAGMVVMRSIPTPEKLARLNNEYQALKIDQQAHTAEIYYLTGLIELNEMERAQTVLTELKQQTNDPNAQTIVKHFSLFITPQ